MVDPASDALLIAYDLTGAGVRLYPLLAPHLGISQITPNRSGGRWGLTTRRGSTRRTLRCSRAAAAASVPAGAAWFTRAGAGDVGDSDGWTDFSRNESMTR